MRTMLLNSGLFRSRFTSAVATTLCVTALAVSFASSAAAQSSFKIWPGGRAPGDSMELKPEADTSEPNKGLVAGRAIIRLGNVTEPEVAFYPAPVGKASDVCVVICPGGGHSILAWDLEGTEVAEWLNGLGINAAVLKYRVPARTKDPRYVAAVQDAQRAMSVLRSRAAELKINPDKIGILGFSAGGETAALATLLPERLYEKVDETDAIAWKPNFALLIYPAYLVNKEGTELQAHVKVTKETPHIFFAHAADDPVRPESSVLLWLQLKQHGVPSELHVFSEGGHGYGLRKTDKAVTAWPAAAEAWLRAEKLLPAK